MKLKTGAVILSMIFTSCLNHEIEEPTITIKPPAELVGIWQELEKKIGDWEPEQIRDGHKLILWLPIGVTGDHYGDLSLARNYKYNPENLGIAVTTSGAINFENGLVEFINMKNGISMEAAAILKYDHDEDTLTLRDTTVIPLVEIKLIRIQ